MHVKIQSGGIAGGSNAGSCRTYARYLGHENRWKEEQGMLLDFIPFYDRNGAAVPESEAVKAIDANKAQLHTTDAKFFSVIISFSQEELASMGTDREEQIASAHLVTGKIMDRYAEGFGTDKVKDRNSLLYFYTMHEMREKEEGVMFSGLHVHVIVSRKDASNRYKLSPMTTYKEGSEKSVIKRGFSRDAFFRDCERIFDRTFGHKRKVEDSYDYCNAMAHGTNEEKEEQIRKATEEKRISEQISAALDARIARMAEEAKEAISSFHRRIINEDKARRDRYWNEYFSNYKPQITDLRKSCDAAFRMYTDARDKYRVQSDSISAQYDRLRTLYGKMDREEKAILRASTAPGLLLALSTLVAAVNPIPAVLLAMVTSLVAVPIAGAAKSVMIAAKQDMRRRAADIRENIAELKEKQSGLKDIKNSALKQYLKVKDERKELQKQMDTLKKELEKPLSNGMTADLARRYHEHVMARKAAENPPKTADTVSLVHSLIFSSKDLVSFENGLRKQGIRFEEVLHPNGGAADFLITTEDGTETASTVCRGQQMAEMLDMWEKITGRRPAYRISEDNEKTRIKTAKSKRL